MIRNPSSQGYTLLDAVKGVQFSHRPKTLRFAGIAAALLCILVLSCYWLSDDLAPTTSSLSSSAPVVEAAEIARRTKIGLCDDYDEGSLPRLLEAEAKYENLREDKFTIVIQTYKRPDVLKETLSSIFANESSLIDQVIIAWNDLETPVPEDYTSRNGTLVHYHQSEVNSLNQKLKPNPAIRTKAVLLGDDDTYYIKEDMEFAFKTWKQTGQNRLVGAWPRRAVDHHDGTMQYSIPRSTYEYNLILTGLAFVHIAFLDYYSSDDILMTTLRNYVDDKFNCEDLALNYVTQSLTGCPPIFAKGRKGPVLTPKPKGMPKISDKGGHQGKRTQCLVDLNDYFGRNPLKTQSGYLVRGAIHAP